MQESIHAQSPHFVLHELTDGVFAAIAQDGGSAISNSGIIDLGGQVVVFDTFLTLQAATDLRSCTENVLSRPPHIVINSHYHNDHIWGNQVFVPEAQIISSRRTRDLITTAGAEEQQWYSANAAQRLETIRSQYANSDDEWQRRELLLWVGYYSGLVETLPHLSVTLPGITFSSTLELHGSKSTAELITFEGAHTGSDTILYLRRAGIVFMSDLLFVRCHPYLAEGDPIQLLKALREVSHIGGTRFVPGHGPVGTSDDLRLMIEYIESCLKTAQELINQGGSLDDRIAELPVAETYNGWQQAKFYQTNIRFLCQWLAAGKGTGLVAQ